VIESRILSWTGHVGLIRKKRDSYRVWCVILRERDHLEYLLIDGRMILKWNQGVGRGGGMDRSGSESGQVLGICESGNEPSVSIKCL